MPTIFRDKVTVQSAGLVTFNDSTARPIGAIEWGLDELQGWKTTPDLDVVSSPIGGSADGEITSDYFPARARHLLASGYCTSETRMSAELLQDVIMRDAFPRNRDLVLTRFEPIPKFLTVRVSGAREFQQVGPNNWRWIVPLMAEDPFKYAANPSTGEAGTAGVAGLSTGGRTYPRTYPLTYTTIESDAEGQRVALHNIGTAPTKPVAVLHGPLPKGGWRLANDTTGEDIRFDVGLTATDELMIDFVQEVALLNGYPVTASISGDFWKVEPGINVIKLYATFDPDAGFDISIKSAWE